jgi:adenylate cyclase class 2
MSYEVEQKFAVADFAGVEAALVALGAQPQGAVEQCDRYFAHPERDFATTDEALRIRRVGDKNVVTYKGPKIDATTKTRRELEISLEPGPPGFDRFAELLLLLGFHAVTEVLKVRRTYTLQFAGHSVEAALDEVAEVGRYVELEVQADEANLAAAQACLAELAQRLQLGNSERRSYLELLLQGRNRG